MHMELDEAGKDASARHWVMIQSSFGTAALPAFLPTANFK